MTSGSPIPQILFEDPHLIVISKPAGLLSQGESQGDPNVVDWLRERLSEALTSGQLIRTYIAWVEGHLPGPVEWTHFLRKDPRTNEVKSVSQNADGAKLARLRAKPRQLGMLRGMPVTLLEYELETGRSHQIRVQSAAEKHALLGDRKYGSKNRVGFTEISRPALHSLEISFPHPISKEMLRFKADLPEDFREITKRIDSFPRQT
jgi:23S rRNA pseudouridine1911/1915/1917 synthase